MNQLRLATPVAPWARLAFGRELFNEEKLDEAIHQLEVLIDIWSMPPADHPHWQPPVRSDIVSARLLMGTGPGEASGVGAGNRTVSSGFVHGAVICRRDQIAWYAYFGSQMFREAAVQYEEYLKSVPNDTRALTTLGIASVRSDRLHQAVQVFRRVVDLDERKTVTRGATSRQRFSIRATALARHGKHARLWHSGRMIQLCTISLDALACWKAVSKRPAGISRAHSRSTRVIHKPATR
jgi:hypothetical protein